MATLLQLKSWWILLDSEWKRVFLDAIGIENSPTDTQLVSICNLKHIFMNVPSEFDDDEMESYQLSTLEPLSMLNNLEDLTVQGDISEITSLEPLRSLLKLRNFSIVSADIEDLSPLENLINLESLTFNNCPVSDLEPIGRLFNLKRICGIGSKINAFHPLLNLPQLKNADFWGGEVNMDALEAFAGFNQSCNVNGLKESMEMANQFNELGGGFFEEDDRWNYQEAPSELQEIMDDMKDFIVSYLEEQIPNNIGCKDMENQRMRVNIDQDDYFIIFDYISGEVKPFMISCDHWSYTIHN